MNILLSYSSHHFRPELEPEAHEFWGASANLLARSLYGILQGLGDVTYIDCHDIERVRGRSFDLFVGIVTNFTAILDACDVGRSVCFAVNMHPRERNALLLDFAAREGLAASSLSPGDLVDAAPIEAALAAADHVLCVGNVTTYNSYVRHGVPRDKVRVVNYGVGLPERRPASSPGREGAVTFLYAASDIGLRKGFDVLAATLASPALAGVGFRLEVMGRPSSPAYERRLQELGRALGERMVVHGWVKSGSAHYDEVLARSDFLLFPSVEEGQAGTVVDALARGVTPIVSCNAGVDHSPLGHFELSTTSPANVELVRRAATLESAERARLSRRTLEHYDEHHAGYETVLADALAGCLRGALWPRASVVLPVFNKEATITRLLGLLDRALRSYGNADLRVILDGCTDRSEELVRRFFAGRNGYPVAIETTPDIFEVKTNNLGLRQAEGEYGVIVQDDNLIYDENFLFEAMTFLEKDRLAAVLGGLAGVNFYPRGTTGLEGPGQIAITDQEVYWRQDAATDPALRDRFFQVDACMRGPLILRTAFLREHGYLDEAYAPLYQDDMDLCMRAADRGYKVYCALMDVDNDSLTMRDYDAQKGTWLTGVMKRNTDLFYARWTPSVEKDYAWADRVRPLPDTSRRARTLRLSQLAHRQYTVVRTRALYQWSLTVKVRGAFRRLRELLAGGR